MVKRIIAIAFLGLFLSSCLEYVDCTSRIDGRNISVLQGSIAETIHCG